MNKNKNILKDSSHLSKIFPEPPKVFYWRKRNMKDILCNSDVTKRMEPDESKTRNRPCNQGSCLLCTSFGKSNLVINKQKDRKLQVKNGGACQTKNIIYLAECLKHNKIYIGQTKNQANRRFCSHRYDMKKATEIPFGSEESGTELSEHFTSSPHDAKDMRVHILDDKPKWKKIERLVLEDYYMCKLKTIEADGLNTKHGMFAKLFYNDY